MVDGNGNGRDGDGRFSPGNPGGPGRPKKAKVLDDATLRSVMASADSGPELYLTAHVLADRDAWLTRIESQFPKRVSDRIQTLVALSDLARGEIARRLQRLPL